MVRDSSSWINNGSLGNRKLRSTGHSVKQGADDAVPSTSNGTSPFPVKLRKTGNRLSAQSPAEQTGPVYSDQVAYEKLLARQREHEEAGSGGNAAAVQRHANMPVIPAKVKIQKKYTVPPTDTSQRIEKNALRQQGEASPDTNSANDKTELLVRPTISRREGMEKQPHDGNRQAWLSNKQRNHPDNRNGTASKRWVSDKIFLGNAGKPDSSNSDTKESDNVHVQPTGLKNPTVSNESESRFTLDQKPGAGNVPKKCSKINDAESVEIATDARADHSSQSVEEIKRGVDDDKGSIVERENNSADESRETDGSDGIDNAQMAKENSQSAIKCSDEKSTIEKIDVDDEPNTVFNKEKELVFAPISIAGQFEGNGEEREELKTSDELPPTIVSTTPIADEEAKNDSDDIDVSNVEVKDLSEAKDEFTTPGHPETEEIWEAEKIVDHKLAEADQESKMDPHIQDVLDDVDVAASEHKNTEEVVDESADRSDEESDEDGNRTESHSGDTATPTFAEKTSENLSNAEENEREDIDRNGGSSLLLAVENGREEDASKGDEVHDSADAIPDKSDAESYDEEKSYNFLAERHAVTTESSSGANIESKEEDDEDSSAHIIPEEESAEQEATPEDEEKKELDPVDVDRSAYRLTENTQGRGAESDDIGGQEQDDDAGYNVAMNAGNDYVTFNGEDGDKAKNKATNASTERDDSNQQGVANHSSETVADQNCQDDIVERPFDGNENLGAKEDNKAVPEYKADRGSDTADSLPSSSKNEMGSPEDSAPDEPVSEKHEVAPDAAKSSVQDEKLLAETVYKPVKVGGRKGSLILSEDEMRFAGLGTDAGGASTRTISWQKVLKHQASPAKVAKALLKVSLTDGQSILFRVKNKTILGELQNDVQRRLDELEAATLSSTYPQIHFKSRTGSLVVSREKLVFMVNGTKGGTKSLSWKKISKHMVTPVNHAKNLLKLVLTTGKSMTFEFESRESLMKIREEITLFLRLRGI